MSTIRIRKTAEPTTPPTDTSRVYVDTADNHLKRKKDDGVVVDYDITVTNEQMQDAVGAILTDTATIDLIYNDGANTITADIVASSITDAQVYEISPIKIGDIYNKRFQATVNTTNNSFATAYTLDCSVDGTILAEAVVTGYRTGGSGGTAGDGASFKRNFRIKTISGVVTIHDLQSSYTSRDVASMNTDFQISGTDINFRVRGATNNNIRWVVEVIIFKNN